MGDRAWSFRDHDRVPLWCGAWVECVGVGLAAARPSFAVREPLLAKMRFASSKNHSPAGISSGSGAIVNADPPDAARDSVRWPRLGASP